MLLTFAQRHTITVNGVFLLPSQPPHSNKAVRFLKDLKENLRCSESSRPKTSYYVLSATLWLSTNPQLFRLLPQFSAKDTNVCFDGINVAPT